jgi:pilus assembly protein Flp/PilA
MKYTTSRLIKSLSKNEDGATAIEYGLIAGLVAIIIITGLTLLGGDLSNMFSQVANAL